MLQLGNFNYVGFHHLQVSHEFLVCASVCWSEADVRCLPHSFSILLFEERVSLLSPDLSDLTRLGSQQIPGTVLVQIPSTGRTITAGFVYGFGDLNSDTHACMEALHHQASPAPNCSYPWDILSVYLIPGNPGIVWGIFYKISSYRSCRDVGHCIFHTHVIRACFLHQWPRWYPPHSLLTIRAHKVL